MNTAISLGDLTRAVGVTEAEMPTFFTKLGSLLFFRNVQGARVIIPSQTQTIGQVELEGNNILLVRDLKCPTVKLRIVQFLIRLLL